MTVSSKPLARLRLRKVAKARQGQPRLTWLKDESLEEGANLPGPDIIAAEIVEALEAALEQFALIVEDLKR